MNTDQKAVAKTTPKNSIRDLLQGDEFKRQVSKVLPRTITPERFARVALTATFRNPRLLECSRESLLQCLMDLSSMGLEPDGRRAHLIPFKDKNGVYQCSLIIDYKGIAELVRRHGDVAHIHCDVVGANDEFQCRFGTGGKLEHTPAINDRGRIYCAYSYVRLKDGAEEYDVMNLEDIERIRSRSRSGHDEKAPWTTDWNEMAKKTVFRRHSKTLPLSPELRDAIERDDELPATEHLRTTRKNLRHRYRLLLRRASAKRRLRMSRPHRLQPRHRSLRLWQTRWQTSWRARDPRLLNSWGFCATSA